MPVTLTEPKQAILLDRVRIANIVIEHNPFLAQYWIEVYIVLGREVDGKWEQHVDPVDGATAQYFHIALGCNPHARPAYFGQGALGAGLALGKCDICCAWQTSASGACPEEGCAGTIQPYDGFQRLCAAAPIGSNNYEVIKNAIYNFLTAEAVPDPATGETRLLLAATTE